MFCYFQIERPYYYYWILFEARKKGKQHMKIKGFDLQVVCANFDEETGAYGDIYTSVDECIRNHPNSKILFGYNLVKTGVETPDWFSTVQYAIDWACRYAKDQTSETALLYTDGSYNKDFCIYGCGLVLLDETGKEISRQHKTGIPQPGQNGWNINGEIEAALMGIQFAINLGYKKVKVYHDYEGVGKWPDKLWKATKPYTKDYADKVTKWRESVSIEFIHVKGHSGNNWNEIADQEARIGAKLI